MQHKSLYFLWELLYFFCATHSAKSCHLKVTYFHLFYVLLLYIVELEFVK